MHLFDSKVTVDLLGNDKCIVGKFLTRSCHLQIWAITAIYSHAHTNSSQTNTQQEAIENITVSAIRVLTPELSVSNSALIHSESFKSESKEYFSQKS